MSVQPSVRRPGRSVAWQFLLVPLCAVLIAAASGCGSSDSGDRSDTGADPIVIYAIAADTGSAGVPSVFPALKASAEKVNKDGGINGRPLKVETCDTAADPNKELQCVRTATSSDAVSIVGAMMFFNPGAGWPIITASKLPVFGSVSLSLPDETRSEYSYPLWASDTTSVAASVVGLASHGCKAVGGILQGAVGAFAPLFNAGLAVGGKWKGVKVLPTIVTPATTPDWSPYVQKAVAEGADCLTVVSLNPADIINAQKAAKEHPDHPLVAVPGFEPPPALLKSSATVAEGLFVNAATPSSYMTSFPIVEQYRQGVEKYDPKAPLDITGLKAWAVVQAFANVAKKAHAITRESLQKDFSASTSVVSGLPGPPIDFTSDPVNPVESRVKTAIEVFGVVKDGTIVPDTTVGTDGVLDLADAYK